MSTLKENFFKNHGLFVNPLSEGLMPGVQPEQHLQPQKVEEIGGLEEVGGKKVKPKLTVKKPVSNPLQTMAQDIFEYEDWGAFDINVFGEYAYELLNSFTSGKMRVGELKPQIVAYAQEVGKKPEEMVIQLAYLAWKLKHSK